MARAADQRGLCAYVESLVDELKRLMPAALKKVKADPVHDARVKSRQLTVALELLAEVGEARVAPLAKRLAKLRRRLGKIRDLDVMLANLKPLKTHAHHASAAKWLGKRFSAAREDALKKLHKRASPGKWIDRISAWRELRPAIEATDAQINAAMTTSLQTQMHSFVEKADRLTSQLLDRGAKTRQQPHELRIAGKRLRYTLEMAAEVGQHPPAAKLKLFKELQKELGLWHDQVVLAERAMSELIDSALAHRDPSLAANVVALATMALKRSDKHLHHFAKIWRAKSRQAHA